MRSDPNLNRELRTFIEAHSISFSMGLGEGGVERRVVLCGGNPTAFTTKVITLLARRARIERATAVQSVMPRTFPQPPLLNPNKLAAGGFSKSQSVDD